MAANTDRTTTPTGPPPGKLEMWRRFRSEKTDPGAFYGEAARQAVTRFPYPLDGRRVVDLGCGGGWFAQALTDAGAAVIGVDLDREDVVAAHERGVAVVAGDGRHLPLPDASVGGVFCSNMLEHTPDPDAIVTEMARVLEDGGWGWLSWTVWYSPWGGHAIAPFHYIGPRVGLKVRTRVLGAPTGKNLPFERLWPTHVGQVLAVVRSHPELVLEDAHPRYWPSQRWILKVPGVRELLTWNCVLRVRRTPRPTPGTNR